MILAPLKIGKLERQLPKTAEISKSGYEAFKKDMDIAMAINIANKLYTKSKRVLIWYSTPKTYVNVTD